VVSLLEDKLDGLKLNHIARRSNEAADELVKLTSGRAPVPVDIFASNQYKPSVTYQGSAQDDSEPPMPASGADPTLAPIDLEVMQIEDDLATGPDTLPDWRIPYLDCLVRSVLLTDKIKAPMPCAPRQVVHPARSGTLQAEPTGMLQRCILVEQGKKLLQ
jgi:hypothetical protein